MNVSLRIVALGALLLAPPAVAEDAYFAIPLRELTVTDGQLPPRLQVSPDVRRARGFLPWINPWKWPYAALHGEGEAYVGTAHHSDAGIEPPRGSPGIVSPILVLRVSPRQKITGRLFVPEFLESGMVAVEFTVPEEWANPDARRTFLRIKKEHYARLAALGIPGSAWFGSQARQAQSEGGFAPEPTPVTRSLPMQFRRSPANLADTYALFSGGRAISENLQLDRVLPAATGTAGLVRVDSLSGVTTREIDWQPLIAGLEPETDPLAARIPADQYAIFFPDVEAAAKIGDLMSEAGTIFLQLAEPRVEDLRIIARYEQQLGLSIRDAVRLLRHVPVRSLAVTGSDLYFSQGTDVAVLLETAEPEPVTTLLLAQIGLATVGDSDVEWSHGQVGGLVFHGVRNSDRTRSSYVARLPGAVVVTNSLYQLGRLASVSKGQATSLVALPEYTFFRGRYARSDPGESALGILSDATIRRLCGPRWRIGDSRRTRDAAILMQLQAAHLDELIAGEVQPRELDSDKRLSAPGSLTLTSAGVVSSTAGSLQFMTPISELPLDRVAREEAAAYDQWRRGYERNWTWAFDPIALRLAVRDDGLGADLTVLPLIVQTQYRPLVSITQGAELAPQAGDPHDALAHAVLAINPRSELFQMGRTAASRTLFGSAIDPFGWIGSSVAMYADDDPFWKELAKVSSANRQKFLVSEGWRLPVGVQVEIADSLKLIAVLASVRTLIDQAAAGMTQWETRTYRDEPYTKISLTERGHRGQQGLDKAALYYAAAGDALVISTNEEVLQRAIDRQIERRQAQGQDRPATPVGKAWLGKSVGLQFDGRLLEALVRFGRQEYQTMMQSRAWGNLPILNEWKRRYPHVDSIVLHQRFWQTRLICPGGSQYVWNDRWQTFESTVYGHPGEPLSGPAVSPALAAFASGNIGLTFEHQGLRMQFDLSRPAAAARASEQVSERAGSEPAIHETPAWGGGGEQHAPIREAIAVLQSDPLHPDANLKVGRFLCVQQGDWQRGVPLVALGSDAAWRAAAEAELSAPATPEEFIRAGTAWWNLAEKLTGPEKQACLLRAGAWYREAAPVVSPISREGQDLAARWKTIEATDGTIPSLPIRQSLPTTATRAPRPSLPRDASTQNLRRLGLALHNYHDTFRRLPPAYRSDESGKPLLSWRVLVLPFLEQGPLYEQFHLDEPWDSEHNRKLIAAMPAVFRSPQSRAQPGKTNYLGVGGQRGIFPGKEGIRFASIMDGMSNTIAVVEVDDAAAIEWTRPGDFEPDVGDLTGTLGGLRNGQFLALLADGSVDLLSSRVPRSTLYALFTRDDGQVRQSPSRQSPLVRPVPSTLAEFRQQLEKRGGKRLTSGFKASWSPDGKRLTFGQWDASSYRQNGGVAIFEIDSGRITNLTGSGKDPAWSPGEGRWIAYVDGGYGQDEQIWLIEPSGANARKIANGGFPSWSADGKSLYYHSRKESALMSLAIGGDGPVGEPRWIFRTTCWYPAVSPDGNQIAHTIGRRMIVTDRESGSTVRTWDLPNPRGFLFAWSPDGKKIAAGGYGQPDQAGISLLDLESGAVTPHLSGPVTMPVWSPDSLKLAIDLRMSSGYEIWMFDAAVLADTR
jgi:Tol biopolymer transport system component